MKHKLYIKNNLPDKALPLDPRVLRRAVCAALDAEDVDISCEVSVVLTDDYGIQAVNRAYRNADKPTDVLSFPLQAFVPGAFDSRAAEVDFASGRVPLGDIVLSAERVRRQAAELGQTVPRETAYLTVHSVLHLLGYDHVDEGPDKRRMRAREKEILRQMGYADETEI